MNGSVRGYVADISLKGCEICDNIVSLKKKQNQKTESSAQRYQPGSPRSTFCLLSVCSPRAKIKLGHAIGAVQTLPYFHL